MVLNQWLGLLLGKHKREITLASILSERIVASVRRERAEHTHHNVREERKKKEKGNLSRFGGAEPVIFKPVIGGSNVVGLVPNLVSSFLT